MNFKQELSKWLRDHLHIGDRSESPVFDDEPYGDGDTENGFITTYSLDIDKLNDEIDVFIQSFAGGVIAQAIQIQDMPEQAIPQLVVCWYNPSKQAYEPVPTKNKKLLTI